MFAVIKTGGKQYLVQPKTKLKIEKLDKETGQSVIFNEVLLISDGKKTEIGTPFIHGVSVTGTIAKQGRARKQIVFRYHAKTRYRKKKGHRQPFTEMEITDIKS